MNPSGEIFYTPENILSDVLKLVGDEDMRVHSKGYYISLVQQALEELSYDTFFFERAIASEISGLRAKMPEDCFSIKELYLFNGSYCDTSKAVNCYWKRNFRREGNATYENDRWNNDDPFYLRRNFYQRKRRAEGDNEGSIANLYYANMQEGYLVFSDNCAKFEKVYIVYYGVGSKIGEEPIIPGFMRQAVHDFVAKKALLTRIPNDSDPRRWQYMLNQVEASLMGRRTHEEGSWYRAEYRIKTMDPKQRKDLKEYLARPNIG